MNDIISLSNFLKYGPTGLAGLMLILVIIALSQPKFGAARERLLRLFMYIGAFCFTLSLAATFFATQGAYTLYFRVIPLDAGTKRVFPLPIIKVNNTPVAETMTYLVKSQATAVIDVTDAIAFVQEVRSQNDQQRQALGAIAKNSDALVADLQSVVQTIDKNCTGGSSGISASSNAAVLATTSRVASALSGFKATAASAISTAPPDFK